MGSSLSQMELLSETQAPNLTRLRHDARFAPSARHVAISFARDPGRGGARIGRRVVTVSLRRESARLREGQDFWRLIRDIGARVLPNTAGCYSVKEAVTTAQMAREVFGTPWIKLEVIGEADTLQPDVFGLVEAARILASEGFEVFPYTTEDLVVAERLLEAGLQGADALGRADRLGQGAQQRVRLDGRCAPISPTSR